MSSLNNFHKINIEDYNRKEHFYFYLNSVPCSYSLTVDFDITLLLEKIKFMKDNNILIFDENIKFYPLMIYLLSSTVNMHREFKMSYKDNTLGYYDIVHPIYTVLNKESKTFYSLYTEYDKNFINFYKNYIVDNKKYYNSTKLSPKECNLENIFYISILPNVQFTSFNLNIPNKSNSLAPIFTMGKYYTRDNKILIPISMQVHHSVCDGYHIGLFTQSLQKNINSFTLNLI